MAAKNAGSGIGTGIGIVAMLACAHAVGCSSASNDTDSASAYREPIPQSTDVLLHLPGSISLASSASSSSAPLRGLHAEAAPSSAPTLDGPPSYYELTRTLTDSIDATTVAVLGEVWLIAQYPATSISANAAVWGPFQGTALSPVSYRLTVTEVASQSYDYVLDARPKALTSEADWQALLTGHGFAKANAAHDTGWFLWNADVQHALDATVAGPETGTTKITYDVHTTPGTIDVVHAPTASGESSYTIDVSHEAEGAGQVDLTGTSNTDDNPSGALENVALHSRWDVTGAGRADASISGGDLPASVAQVDATECWSRAFTLLYYQDSVNYEPTVGAVGSCAFPNAITAL